MEICKYKPSNFCTVKFPTLYVY